jgi:hypothetical protein
MEVRAFQEPVMLSLESLVNDQLVEEALQGWEVGYSRLCSPKTLTFLTKWTTGSSDSYHKTNHHPHPHCTQTSAISFDAHPIPKRLPDWKV